MPRFQYKQITLKKKDKNQICNLDSLLKTELSYCINEITVSDSYLIHYYDPENLHQMRVTLRRMKSLLRFFKNEISNNNWKTVNSLINKLIKPTSEVRDFDVTSKNYIIPACRENKTLQESKILLNQSNEKLTKLHENIINTLSSAQYQHLLTELHSWIIECNWRIGSPFWNIKGKTFSTLIEDGLNERYKFLMRRIPKMARLDRKTLHKIRIEVKELRYLVDIFRFYIKKSKRHLNTLKVLQDNLGIINDTYIAEQLINGLNIRQSDKNRSHIAALVDHQRTHCLHNISTHI